jgi:DHA1 family bicyclomycin/chloramphenicol resistance-like MFS transporter
MSHSESGAASSTRIEADQLPRYLIVFIGALVAIGPLSLDAYLPAMPAMADAFGVGIVRINNTISVYLIGYGLGQFFGGALSDQIGRKRVGLIGLAVFTLASLLIAFAHSVEQVQWLRFVQAIGGGFSTVICMAIVRDVYPIEELGKRMAMVTMIMLASPVIAPSVGAFLLRFGWPAIFFFKAAYASTLAVIYGLFISETRPGRWSNLSIATTLRQCYGVVTRKVDGRRIPMRYAFSMSLAASVFMTFLTNSSFAYIEYFGVSETLFPLYFGASILGLMATNMFSIRRLTRANARRFFGFGIRAQGTAVIMLLVIVLSGAETIWLIVLPMAIVVASFGLTGPSGSSQYMSHFDKLAGSASSIYTTLLFAMGASFGAVSSLFFDGSLRPMVLTMGAASLLANLLASLIPKRQAG